jgi:hypothetical protein
MEYIESSTLTLDFRTSKGVVYHKVFKNYAELFDWGCLVVGHLPDVKQFFTHVDQQWARRGEHYKQFSKEAGDYGTFTSNEPSTFVARCQLLIDNWKQEARWARAQAASDPAQKILLEMVAKTAEKHAEDLADILRMGNHALN